MRRFVSQLLIIQLFLLSLAVESELHQKCELQCAEEVLSKGLTTFDHCMNRCFADGGRNWLIGNQTSVCESKGHDLSAPPACSTGTANIVSFNFSESKDSRVVHEYIIVTWTPCPYGFDDVKGYEVRLREVNMHNYVYCKQVYLKQRLTLDALTTFFSVLFENQELTYGREYSVEIEGLPKTSHRYYYPMQHFALSCPDLNGQGSCECGLEEIDPAPTANITVSGYTVFVAIPRLKPCFGVYMFKLAVLNCSEKVNVLTRLQEATIYVNNRLPSHITHTFQSVYPPGSSCNNSLFFQYRAFAYGGKSLPSQSLLLNISNWKPNAPSLDGGVGKITISWDCAPPSYNVAEYQVQLNWYGFKRHEDIRFQINSSFHSNCSSERKMSAVLQVRNGIYKVRVREYRDSPSHQTPWSSLSDETEVVFHGFVVNERDAIIAISVILPLTTIIISVLITCYCVKKGRCKKIQHRVPSLTRLWSHRSTLEHRCCIVWIVWQADTRSSTHKELHAANIRHLAAFLTNCCGLSVLLDQYEVPTVSGFTAWLQEKKREAEFVLFVCPHLPTPLDIDSPCNVMGNFSAVFRLFQNDLLREEISVKFATLLLPYSDTSISDAVKLLLSTTPTFRLMDEIESFYFFVQGFRKAGPFGRHVVKFINKKEYAETVEGLMLKNGIEEMTEIVKFDDLDGMTSLAAGQTEDSTLLAQPAKDIKENHLEPVCQPPDIRNEMLERKELGHYKPLPPPPVIVEEDADQSLFMLNSGSQLLSLQPIESEPVDPVGWSTPFSPSFVSSSLFRQNYNRSSLGQSGSPDTCTTALSPSQ